MGTSIRTGTSINDRISTRMNISTCISTGIRIRNANTSMGIGININTGSCTNTDTSVGISIRGSINTCNTALSFLLSLL